jgi:hypothetical protein
VAPELLSEGGTAGVYQGGRLQRVGTRTKVDRWKALIDYPNPAYLCMTVRGGIPEIYRMVWVKYTTSAECRTIRIAESSVMDGCKDHYIAQCQVLVL